MTDASPAERYAAARQRIGEHELSAFRESLSVDLDPFQEAACRSLEAGRSVLVAAPTGAGKTLVAQFAIFLAMRADAGKVFYTTPMKALSNQKFNELVEAYGPDDVGLLTGDTSVNATARIVVMTTEVLRNMIYAGSDLLVNLAFVVLDEVHYLADRFRGGVWEEVIIHLAPSVRTVSLSATVSNAEEFGDWLQAVRGDTDVIVSEERPVPLHQHVLVSSHLYELFAGAHGEERGRVNPELQRQVQMRSRPVLGKRHQDHTWERRHGRPSDRLSRPGVVELLDQRHLLPAIVFIFSRAGCDGAVAQLIRAGVRLTSQEERDEIRRIVDARTWNLRDEDLAVLGYWDWLDGLSRGVAAHHAGLLPAFKETVEELFQKKLLKVVFATETLALGINMPARTVMIEKLEKFNGEARVPITPGEYTQLTGRAGRRGIDTEGHAVVQWSPEVDPRAVASLASRRSYPLNSSFKPSYNMAVNLIDAFGRDRTRELLESSFAQFQADRAVVDLAQRARQQEQTLAGYARAMQDESFAEYAELRRGLGDAEKRAAKGRGGRSQSEQDAIQRELASLRASLREHPAHRAADREERVRWAERWRRLQRDHDRLLRQIESRTGAIARRFDRVTDVLLETGHLADGPTGLELTVHGRALKRIYGERDLLIAESLRRRLWSDLDANGLAALVVSLVFEPRGAEAEWMDRRLPRGAFERAFDRTRRLWLGLDELERRHGLAGSEPPAVGLVPAMYRWAAGGALEDVLRDAELAAGDFVRWTKQTIDVLDQIAQVADGRVAATARQAVNAVRRGIVAYSSLS